MCSIEGTTNTSFDISKFTDINKCRGPDGTHFFEDENVRFGHNLLEISPNPTKKVQPFVTEKGNVLVYNGEIYGLKEDVWDVEWLANCIETRGLEALKENVNGMWAFAWYEPAKSKLTLCRDHFGVKPLYYSIYNDYIYFSSTLLPLAGLWNQDTVSGRQTVPSWDNRFEEIYALCDGFNPGSSTILANIYKLYPGQIIQFDVRSNKELGRHSLWDSNFHLKPNFLWDKWQLKEIVERCISEVCNAPNVKKTISLSGGLDSSLIASISKNKDKISASSVHWEETNINKKDPSRHMLDEIALSKDTCKKLNMDHYITQIPHDYEEYINETYSAMFGIPSWDIQRLLPRFFNITQAAKNKNKIYITGDCADELLTGYNGDFKLHSNEQLSKEELFFQLGYDLKSKPLDDDIGYREVGRMVKPSMFKDDIINNRQFRQLMFHCDGFCTVLDHMCGYYGMESRVPFLHQRLAKYLLTIPGQIKLSIPFDDMPEDKEERYDYKFFMLGHYKVILREYFKEHYTDGVRKRMRKTGFSNPWDARDPRKNEKLRKEQYIHHKRHLNKKIVDFKDDLMYNLIHDIKSENVNE